jgi:hypothetical protein
VRLADGQVTVAVGIDVLSLGTLDERTAQFSLQCYFRQFWRDRRLQFNDTVVQTNKPKVHTYRMCASSAHFQFLPLNAQRVLNEIWHPDTYIRNGKYSYLHQLTVPNRLLRIRHTCACTPTQTATPPSPQTTQWPPMCTRIAPVRRYDHVLATFDYIRALSDEAEQISVR